MPNTCCVFVYHFQPGWEEMSFCFGAIWHKPFDFIDLLRMIYRTVKYPYMKMTTKERQKAIYRKVYGYADRIVLLSNNFVPLFSEYGDILDENKYKVINNMLSFDDFFDMERYDEKRKEVVVVSRFDEQQKRLSLAIRIWSQLETDSELTDWRLRIIGHGEDEGLYRRLASELGLKRLTFEGKQDPQPYYRDASLFMMTSLSEGWGLTLTEAQQMGCVPIAFNTYASLTDIITDGYNGFIIEDNDLDSYVTQMKQLMLDARLRKKMAANASESSRRFEKHSIGKQWNDLFTSMTKNIGLTTVNKGGGKNQPLISIIVPVYKADRYLRRCTDSLLAQTYRNIEVILVDDGSPDNSGLLCDEVAQEDGRVKVIHKENSGVSDARQCGMDVAIGEYVIHADPDDWADLDMLETMYAKAKADNADMVMCDFYIETQDSGTGYRIQHPSASDHATVQRELFQQLQGSCCNKLVRRACYNEYGIRFPKGAFYAEDGYVTAALLNHDIRISYLPCAFYHYDLYSNANSLVKARNYGVEHYLRDMKLLDMFLETVKDEEAHRLCRIKLSNNFCGRAFEHGLFTSKEFRQHFRPFLPLILQSKGPLEAKAMKIISCMGFYHFAYRIHKKYLQYRSKARQFRKYLNT